MTGRLTRKVALVTGGGSGIGEAICRRFAEEGALVVVTDIDEVSAEKVASSIINLGGEAVSRPLDVAAPEHWDEVIRHVVTEYGTLDVLGPVHTN